MTHSERQHGSTTDMNLRRANALAQLDIEHQRAEAQRRTNPLDEFDRRIERLEASIAELYRLLGAAA